jgi:hypothetical protein
MMPETIPEEVDETEVTPYSMHVRAVIINIPALILLMPVRFRYGTWNSRRRSWS